MTSIGTEMYIPIKNLFDLRCWFLGIDVLSKVTFSEVKEFHGKFLICMGNAKIEKIKTYFSFKIISKENYVLQNAKYVDRGEIKNFP